MGRLMAGACWLLLLAVSSGAEEQPAPLDGPGRIFNDQLLEQMIGEWRARGSIRGQPAVQDIRVDWVLNHQFLRIHEKGQAPSKAGFTYEAMVFVGFDNASERYVAHWIDVFGGRWSETLGYGRRDGNAIEFVFEYPDGPFRTAFEWQPERKAWRCTMRAKNPKGAWTDFASLTLERPK